MARRTGSTAAALFWGGIFALLLASEAQAACPNYDKATEAQLAAFDLQQKGDVEGAVTKFREANTLCPNDKAAKENFADALNAAGVALYQKKEYAGAIAHFQEALQLVPKFQHAKENLAAAQASQAIDAGMVLFKNGDFAAADAKFKEALAIDPGNVSGQVNADTAEGLIMMKSGDHAGAVEKFKDALSKAPNNAFIQGKLKEAQDAAAADEAAKAAAEKAKQQPAH